MAIPESGVTVHGREYTPPRPAPNFLLSRRDRPPPMDEHLRHEDGGVPLNTAKMQRRESKFGLRGIFRRSKTEGQPTLDALSEALPTPRRPKTGLDVPTQDILSPSVPSKHVAAPPSPRPTTPVSRPTPKASRMSLKPKPTPHSKPRPKSSPKRSTKPSPKPPARTSTAWDPPPLFQAYPQAIKHATLSASTLSADSILRISNHQRNNSLRDEIAQTAVTGDAPEGAKKGEKARKHRRQTSGSVSKAEWTQKIFVLVTSGYLLQYAGEGSFDRLPEKMMQLGKDSVAFASDVIPGKHWVLQISQAMAPDGTPASDSRSILSRLAFRGAGYRRAATSLLLVLNSAEDMDSWIAVVRREIEALGGKQHVSETGKPRVNEIIKQVRVQPSHRYLVARNPDRFSTPSPRTPSMGPPPWGPDETLQEKLDDAAAALLNPPCLVRPSTGSDSICNSVISHDGKQLDSLRDSTHRLSYMSSGQRTLLTSQCSSPTSSPTRESNSTYEETPKTSIEDARLRPNAATISERRRSMQAMRGQLFDSRPASKSARSQSIYDLPFRAVRAASPPAPNFSVPSSSSRRFSTSKISMTEQLAPSSLTIATSRTREPLLKGHRKAPPAALKVHRQLSPVKDSPSPKRVDWVETSTEAFPRITSQAKSLIANRPRSRSSARSTPKAIASRRASSFTSPNPADFKFPLQLAAKQPVFEDHARISHAPLRPPPPPPSQHKITSILSLPPDSGKDLPKSTPSEPETENDNDTIPPLPLLSTTAFPTPKTTLRRPASMQIQPTSTSTTRSRSPPTLNSLPPTAPLPTLPTSASGPKNLTSPSLERLKLQSKAIANRRSMPMLVSGPPGLPPMMPPPSCALPPLPVGGGSGMKCPLPMAAGVRGVVRA